MKNVCRESATRVWFWCPGCECNHGVVVDPAKDPSWSWNESLTKPTFKPSIFVNPPDHKHHNEHEPSCHSFVTDGKIRFLNDCSHKLAGQTVDLQPYDE